MFTFRNTFENKIPRVCPFFLRGLFAQQHFVEAPQDHMLIHMVSNEDSTSWLMDISLVLGHPPDLRHFGHHLDRTGALQSSEIRGENRVLLLEMGEFFDAEKSGDLI